MPNSRRKGEEETERKKGEEEIRKKTQLKKEEEKKKLSKNKKRRKDGCNGIGRERNADGGKIIPALVGIARHLQATGNSLD